MKIYLVGGAIRNKLLNLPVKDKDWVVVGATPKEMIKKGYKKVGNDFPVFLHPITKEEYALARTEKKSGIGYKGFITKYSPNITLEQDLIRRDLTINAIAQDKKGKYIDPCGGIRDIKLRLLKHISNSFVEDPLRVLRVARFFSYFYHLGFRIFDDTMKLMKNISIYGDLNALKKERVWKETENALKGPAPQIYFQVLYDCYALNILFPEINNFYKLYKKKFNKNNSNYCFNYLNIISKLSQDIDVRFSSFIYYIIKRAQINKKKYFTEKNNIYIFDAINLVSNLYKKLYIPKYIYKLTILVIQFSNFFSKKNYHILELVDIFDSIDVWRKPVRIEKIFLINQINNQSPKKEKNFILKKNFLIKALNIASKICVQSIIKDGFKGKKIKIELKKRRINAIKKIKNPFFSKKRGF